MMHTSNQRGKLVTPNGDAYSDDATARLLGVSLQDCKKSIEELLSAGVAHRCPESGALMCPAMVQEEKLRRIRQTSGRKGGNPVLLKQNVYVSPYPPPHTHGEHDNELGITGTDSSEEGSGGKPLLKLQAPDPELSIEEMAEEIYQLYPKHIDKEKGLNAITRSLTKYDSIYLREKTKAYAEAVKSNDRQFIPYPATWFNRSRFNEDPSVWTSSTAKDHRAEKAAGEFKETIKAKELK